MRRAALAKHFARPRSSLLYNARHTIGRFNCHWATRKEQRGRAVLGIEPRTSRTRSENHATRPNSHVLVTLPYPHRHRYHVRQLPSRGGQTRSTPRGFEPLRAEPNGFRVHLLSRSDTVSRMAVSPRGLWDGRGTALSVKAAQTHCPARFIPPAE